MSRGFDRLEAGTSTALHEPSAYIQAIQRRQGVRIGCPEAEGSSRGFLEIERFESLIQKILTCEYSDYLRSLAGEWHRLKGEK